MGFGFLGSIFVLTLFFRSLTCQQLNTDGFFVSDFFQRLGLVSSHAYNFSSPVCSWQLVFCDAKQENVIGLVAPNLGLSGSIPETTIGKLKQLQSLDLSNNLITALPSDFWSLSSLKTLNLSSNKISMSLPSNLGNFDLLEKLDLSSNNFAGLIPDSISALVNLQVLNLNHNGFTDIPLGFLNCHSLVSIDLSENSLNGTLPDGFGSAFPKLKFLNLAENQIHGRDLGLSRMMSINHLNISGNLFQGSVVEIFQGQLEVVDVSRNNFEGHISQVNFSSSFNWSHLVYLDFSGNQLSGGFSDSLNKAQNLKHLNLADNRFSKQKFLKIDALLGLEYLNLSNTNLEGSIPSEILLLTSLRILDLSNNHLRGRIPLLSIKRLKSLDLSINNLSGGIPMSILKRLPWMERYNFSLNNLTLCDSTFSLKTLQSAFIGSSYSCPIAVNPGLSNKKTHNHHQRLKLALALTLSLVCFLIGLLLLAFCCRRKTHMWAVKQTSYKEEQNISGPFSFQTDSTTWVADVKQATSVPVIIFEKPLVNFTFADLLSATSNFERGTLLAEGRFGPVYRGFLPGGIHVAIKVLVHGSAMTDQEASREIEYLGRVKHPNLVPLTGYCLAGEQKIAIYEYMENGNLQNLLHDLPLGVQTTEDWSTETWEENDENNNGIQNVGHEGKFTMWRFRHKVALGTARALAYLHHGCSPPIIHRDVKASNVYLDFSLEPRLSDFGLANIFGDRLGCGSHDYVPPEFLQQDTSSPRIVTPKIDVYGFGVILLELITGKKPIDDDYSGGNSKEATLVSWVRGLVRKSQGSIAIDPKIRGTGLESQMVEALKIGYLCTAEDPSKRPSMQQVVGILKDIEPVASQ